MFTRQRLFASSFALASFSSAMLLVACVGSTSPTKPTDSAITPATQQGSVARINDLATDRDVWHELLQAHTAIRRTVRHLPDGVDALTESDDPAAAAKIIEHAKAMQARVKAGARIRVWDPVFAELFQRHDSIQLEITPTDKGVRIVERSSDPQTVLVLRAHAMGVNQFVRDGFDAAPRKTPTFQASDPIPAPELAIGGVRHRFILAQPDGEQLNELKSAGVATIINFRKPTEHPEYDEHGAAERAGLKYCNLPYAGAAEVTDELLAQARAAMKDVDETGTIAAMHCRTGNRVGPGWASYRVLDKGISVEQAIGEAKAMQMLDPLMEAKTRDYIRHQRGASNAWSPAPEDSLSPVQQSQRDRAIAARDAMFSRLFSALGEAMNKPGPEGGAAGAIGVCKQEAPRIAQAVARETGVMIGRTSSRLRNPANGAPAWTASVLATQPAERQIVTNADGSLAMVMPIKLSATCLGCHGPSDTMDPAVRNALAAKYPNDKATGYSEGEIRGWFWVEVPPNANR